MESSPPPNPILQKPPGHRDPSITPPLPPPPAAAAAAVAATPPPVKPRKPVLPPSFQPKPKRRSCCRVCCCTFCIALFVLLFAVVIAVGLFYLIYDPSLPEFHLESFQVPMLNVSVASDGAYLDAETAARVEVKNWNGRIAWRFEQSSFRVTAKNYDDLNLGSTKVAAFKMKEKEVKELKVETKVKGEALDERQRRRLKGTLESKVLMPSVEVKTKVGVVLDGWNSVMLGITVVCGDVTMRQLEKGDMPLCTYTLLKW